MESLLYIVVWIGLMFLMMRFGCGAHMAGRGHKSAQQTDLPGPEGTNELHWISPENDVDPVCQKTIPTDNAKTALFSGNVYHFCSRDCREVFEAAPELYTNAGNKKQKRLEQARV